MSLPAVTRAVTLLSVLFLVAGMSYVRAGGQAPASAPKPTAADAEKFLADAEARLNDLSIASNRASWVQSNFITDDTQLMAAAANERLIAATTELAKAATRFEGVALSPESARKLRLLKLLLPMPAPANPAELQELTRIAASLEADYGKGKFCQSGPSGQDCLDVNAITRIMAESRDPKELQRVWTGWRTIAPPMRERYARFVELSNKGAREMGFADVGAMWRSTYDMPPDQFEAELQRLWTQVKPLYLSLHAYVRTQLAKKYGADAVRGDGAIPAHLLGNIWAQEWGNVYDVVAPQGVAQGYDLTKLLRQKGVDAKGMVRYGEGFFSSLGFAPLPPTFWERSLFVKPRDRDVVCHASAWSIDNKDDVRLKMCIEITGEDFVTVHHELGHNYYQRAYNGQPFLFQGAANDGFHEAVGDTIALSVTPGYLKQLGLLDQVPPESADLPMLLRQALDKVAFLPFGLVIDKWRYGVFSGRIAPANYNQAWWSLVNEYQGVAAPSARSEQDFDPGAKYHVPANTPYMRYFLARILQFQFHRAMCREAGFTGPLSRCSVYGNAKAGSRLQKMLAMGTSRPWPEELEALTGERQIDATALLDYFAPLQKWLDEQNKGQKVGWGTEGSK